LRRGAFLTISVLTAVQFCLFSAMFLVPALLVDLSREFNTTVAAVGQMNTVAGITWAIGAPLVSPFSDHFGRKRMIIIGHSTTILALLGFSISPNLAALLGFSVLAGLGGACTAPNALAATGDYFSAEKRGRITSVVYGGMPLGALAGAPLGAVIADAVGWRWSFLALALFMVAVIPLLVTVLPHHRRRTTGGLAYTAGFRQAFRYGPFLPLITGNLLLQTVYYTVSTYLPAFLIQSYALTTGKVAPFLTLLGIAWLIGTIVGGPFADRFSKMKMCAILPIPMGISGVFIMLFTPGLWVSVSFGLLFMFFYGVHRTPFFSACASVPGEIRGIVMGTQAATNHIGRSVGAMGGGLIVSLLGYSYLGGFYIILMGLASATFARISSYKFEA